MRLHGLEADRHLLRCLFTSVDLSETSTAANSSTSSKLAPAHGQALLEHYDKLLNKPSLLTDIGYVADKQISNQKVSYYFLFCKQLSKISFVYCLFVNRI